MEIKTPALPITSEDALDSDRQRTTKSWIPSLPAVLFLLLGVMLPSLFGSRFVGGDGDPLRHLRLGHEMLETGRPLRTDAFSYTKPGAPFVGIEYGTQALLAAAEKLGGLPGVAVFAGLLIAGTYATLLAWLLRRGVAAAWALATVFTAMTLGAPHWIARPHLVTWLLTVLLLWWLDRERGPRLWQVALFFAVWANLHGGFVYGVLLLGALAVGEWLAVRTGAEGDPVRARQLAGAASVAAAASTLTPYGVSLPLHVLAFFRDPVIRSQTTEFFSPNFHQVELKPFLILLLLMTWVLARGTATITLPRTVVIVMNLGFALLAQRNIPLFGLTALPLFVLSVRPRHRPGGLAARISDALEQGRRHATTAPWIAATCAGMLVLAAAHGRLAGLPVVDARLDPADHPVNAIRWARSQQLHGRIFHEFTWGGDLLYAWPEQPVFIDPGTDHYGGEHFREYLRMLRMAPGWRERFDRWRIDMALLEPGNPLSEVLARSPGWRVRYCDATSALLTKDDTTRAATDSVGVGQLRLCADSAVARAAHLSR